MVGLRDGQTFSEQQIQAGERHRCRPIPRHPPERRQVGGAEGKGLRQQVLRQLQHALLGRGRHGGTRLGLPSSRGLWGLVVTQRWPGGVSLAAWWLGTRRSERTRSGEETPRRCDRQLPQTGFECGLPTNRSDHSCAQELAGKEPRGGLPRGLLAAAAEHSRQAPNAAWSAAAACSLPHLGRHCFHGVGAVAGCEAASHAETEWHTLRKA